MRRRADAARAVAASFALALLLVGLPMLLVLAVGWPLPRQLPHLSQITDTFAGHEPLETLTVWKILAVILWLAWLQIAVAVVLEAIATARGALPRSIPGFNLAHGLVAPLVAAIVLAWPVGSVARAEATPSTLAAAQPPPTMSTPGPLPQPPVPPAQASPNPTTIEHTVQRRETLWDLAERYLGDGYRSRELFELNRGRPQPDGDTLTDPGVIRPGWIIQMPAAATPEVAAASVTVHPGDTLWEIAADELHDGHRYVEIVDLNEGHPQADGSALRDPDLIEPGWVLELPTDGAAVATVEATAPAPPAPVAPPTSDAPSPPPTSAPPTTATPNGSTAGRADSPADDADSSSSRPLAPLGLVGGGVATAGLLLALQRRRRAQLRRRERGQVPPGTQPDIGHAEIALRAGADPATAKRLDEVTRHAAAANGSTGLPHLHHVEANRDGISLVLDQPAPAPPGFVATDPTRWEASDRDTVADTGSAAPVPALVPVGVSPEGNEILVDLESPAVTTVVGDQTNGERVIRAMAVAAASAPWADHARVLVVGHPPLPLDAMEEVPSLDAALDEIEARTNIVRRTLASVGCSTLAQARAAGVTPDVWAPLVVFATSEAHELQLSRLRALGLQPPLGVAVVVSASDDVAPVGRLIAIDGEGIATIDGELTVAAHLLTEDETSHVTALFEDTDAECVPDSPPTTGRTSAPRSTDEGESSSLAALLADIDVVVRVLGEVEAVRVASSHEERLTVTKQKSLEAITYLALRDVRVDREDLQAALWPSGANSTKTFHNTIWAARKMLGQDRDETELLPEPTEGHYLLGDRVATDYALFHELTARADELEEPAAAAALLADALTLVRGEPFLGVGRGYAWVAPHSGLIVAQVVDAAEELAEMRLAAHDWRAAEWAARQGLRVFPCEERLYRLLMRAAHAAGSMPGVHRAFQELAGAVADPDDGVEPEDTIHPETVALLEELTGQRSRVGRASA